MQGTIVRINRYGPCEVRLKVPQGARRSGFSLDQLYGYRSQPYRGQPMKEFGIRVRADVKIEEDGERPVAAARLLKADAHAHS